MSNLKPIKYSEQQLLDAKELYMQYKSRSEISELSGIPVDTLKHYISKKGWKDERELLQNELFKSMMGTKKQFYMDIAAGGLELLSRSITHYARDKKKILTPKELKSLMNTISELDKIVRLDDGTPTEIQETIQPASMKELRDIVIEADPFADDIEDAEIIGEEDA